MLRAVLAPVQRVVEPGLGQRPLRLLEVDLRLVAPASFGAALVYFTGSKGHNIKLRQRALVWCERLGQGAVVPGAKVSVRNLATGVTRTAETDADGAYRFVGLPPGRYLVDAAVHTRAGLAFDYACEVLSFLVTAPVVTKPLVSLLESWPPAQPAHAEGPLQAIVVLGGLGSLIYVANRETWAPLYTNISNEDAATVKEKLDKSQIPTMIAPPMMNWAFRPGSVKSSQPPSRTSNTTPIPNI